MPNSTNTLPRSGLSIFAAVVAVVVLVHLPGLGLWPIVNHDEVALNDAAWHWVSQGTVAMPLLAGKDPSYATNYLWHPPAHMVTMALAYRVAGLSVYVTRGVTLAFAALGAGMIFLVTRRLAGSLAAGVVAAFLFAANPLSIWLARSGRMDPAALCTGLVAWLVLVRAGRDNLPFLSFAKAVVAGLILGLASLYHVLLLVWTPAFAAALLVRHGRGALGRAVVLCAAATVPLLGWLAWVAATGRWHAWVIQFWDYQVMQRSDHDSFLMRPWRELCLALSDFRFLPFVGLAVVAGFAAWAVRLRESGQAWLLAGLLTVGATVAFVLGKGTGAYPIYWYTWLAITSGLGWQDLLRKRWARLLLGAAALNVGLFMAGMTGIAYWQGDARSQARVDAFLKANLRPYSVVLGVEELWYATNRADCTLHIWEKPDATKEDYYVTPLGVVHTAPPGFRHIATLPDIMPRVFGRTGWYTNCAYDLWESIPRTRSEQAAKVN